MMTVATTSTGPAVLRTHRPILLTAASLAVALGACAPPEPEEAGDQVAVEDSALKNGTVLANGAPWKGVVRVEIWSQSERKWHVCTGQVTSAQTVLTAAHCAWSSGNTSYHSNLYVRITRQTSAGLYGEWLHPESYILADVQVNPSYTTDVAKYDLSVMRGPNPWAATTPSHAAGLMKSNPNLTLWAFGYGNWGNSTNPDEYDQQGRAGQAKVTYNSTYKDYRNNASSSDPQLCIGDSGGPLKSTFLDGSLSYGVASQLIEYSGACGTKGEWATTSNNWTWLKNTIGNCTDKVSYISCW